MEKYKVFKNTPQNVLPILVCMYCGERKPTAGDTLLDCGCHRAVEARKIQRQIDDLKSQMPKERWRSCSHNDSLIEQVGE